MDDDCDRGEWCWRLIDFTTSAGEPYPLADGGRLQWGGETKKITLEKQPHLGCVSHDGKLLALAVEHDIYVVDKQSWETIVVLKGHTSKVDGEMHWMYEASNSGWRRTISWHPNSQWLAVGGERSGELLLLDVKGKKLLQRRLLSVDASTSGDEVRSMLKTFLGVAEVRFLDGGNKLAVWTYGDWSIEMYDINQEVKWKFARGGTEDGPEADRWMNEQGKVTSGRGYYMLTWEDRAKGVLQLASLDFDGVRIWGVSL
ncbi:hypothetical protein ACHAPU_000600 [Fusarium lateritium]